MLSPSSQGSAPKKLLSRPPVIVVMGHIDHGKSTLLDHIRKANVVAGEAGGITQHMGAYQAEHVSADGTKHVLTFLDTPGHEAFGSIRERGTQAADIAIVAVSAEDGVKPQTLDALRSITAAKIPYIIAITKIDKPNANTEKTKQSLGENEVYVEGWGGDIPCVEVSAVKGTGMSDLLDMILLVAGLADLTYRPDVPAQGRVIESAVDTRKGISATLLVRDGTLHIGSFVVAGGAYAPVRFIEDHRGDKIASAEASLPIRILGWSAIPDSGSAFQAVSSKKEAERIVEEFKTTQERRMTASQAPQAKAPTVAADKIIPGDKTEPITVTLPLVIKADTVGSLEGVRHELRKIHSDKVALKIVSEAVGEINENDIKIAQSDPSIIVIGFNAPPDKKAKAMIERSAAPIVMRDFAVIYELVEFVKEAHAAKIPKEYVEETTGRAKIIALFSKEKDRQVAGGKVESGGIQSGNDIRIIRRDAEIGRGKIRELQQQKKRVDEVKEGYEFGAMIEAKVELAPGDRIEAVRTVEKR